MEVRINEREKTDVILPIVTIGNKDYSTGYSITYTTCDCIPLDLLEELAERMDEQA